MKSIGVNVAAADKASTGAMRAAVATRVREISIMTQRPFYHEGMRAYQDRYDGRRISDALERNRKHYEFWEDELELIETAPFLFIATAWDGYVDCSVKSGNPGFIKVFPPNIIEFPEYDGNSMYRTIGNIAKNPNIGLLFVRFDGKSRRMRINGRAEILESAEDLSRHHGAKLVVRVTCEIYPNCPRYVPNLTAGIASVHSPRPGYEPPPPEWKQWDFLKPHLPHDDPHFGTPSIEPVAEPPKNLPE
ncbi:putative pyridoxine 5'-phosphate oxidase superfamily flavin-nucleotide-binding protein [Bradyrhizobium sp. GM24.11]